MVETSLKPTKKGSLAGNAKEPSQIAPPGFEPGLIESESIGGESLSNGIGRFHGPGGDASANASPKTQKTDVETGADSPVEPDVLAALAMIERLPLSDAEKAEAVRRLLARPGI